MAALRRAGDAWRAGVALACLTLAPAALGQTESQVTLTRKDTTIVVTLKAQYANGARFIGNNPNCADGMRQTLLYGPDPGFVDTKVGSDTELRSNVAVVRSPEGGTAASGSQAGSSHTAASQPSGQATSSGQGAATQPGSSQTAPGQPSTPAGTAPASSGPAGSGAPGTNPPGTNPAGTNPAEQQTLELFDGSVTISRAGCIATADRATKPSVTLVQGRTTVKGTRFFLDQGSDTGTMDGPIELTRAAKGDSPSLDATADRMTFDTQTRHTTLTGNVRVTSAGRVTTASTLQLDEAAGLAVLTGSPAKSVKGQDVLQGSTLRYYLNSNDVVVLGGVKGDIQIESP